MKGWICILLFLSGVVIGYLVQEKPNPEIITETKIDTIKVAYVDTVYKFFAKEKRIVVRDTVLLSDTITYRDTVYVNYYSPFKIGTDTLNCSGIVNFDMNRFTFQDVKFKYPSRVITKTVYITKTDWGYTAIGTSIGVAVGIILGISAK